VKPSSIQNLEKTEKIERLHCQFHPLTQGQAMPEQGSAGNVIAALCSFFIPGLGQLVQGRLLIAIIQFVLAALLWIILLGWIIHLWSILDAAMFKTKA
jgi:TM2 domain-containing membrane protein YozV